MELNTMFEVAFYHFYFKLLTDYLLKKYLIILWGSFILFSGLLQWLNIHLIIIKLLLLSGY